MPVERLAIVSEPLSVERLTTALEALARDRGEGCGALCAFVGTVRAVHQGRQVRYLEYEAYAPLAVRVFGRIEREIDRHWPGALVAIHHRIGRLEIGEASVAIVVATPHRGEAFQSCRYAIERVKQVAPIWKHEFFADGDMWVEGAPADPEDEAAQQRALERACA